MDGGRVAHQLHDDGQLVLLDDAVEVADDVRVLPLLQQPDLVHALVALLGPHLEDLKERGARAPWARMGSHGLVCSHRAARGVGGPGELLCV